MSPGGMNEKYATLMYVEVEIGSKFQPLEMLFPFFFFFEILTFQSSQIAGKITGNKMHVEEINKLCSYFWRIYKRDVVKLQFSDK